MALTKISTGGVKDDAASQAKIADEAVDEARLQVSNAGSNGQFLQKQSGNTGGLTWSDVPAQYTHPNHSGEVTSTADGAQVIASNVVDEDNLKVSNTPTNGQFLSAQSGNTGGLTWADVTIPDTDKIEEGNTSVETVDTGSDGHVKITTEGTERVRIMADGKVGIGVTPANYQLQVPFEGRIGFHNGSSNYGYFEPYNSNGDMEFDVNFGGGDGDGIVFMTRGYQRLRISTNGAFGLGPSNNYGSAGQVLTASGGDGGVSWATPSGALGSDNSNNTRAGTDAGNNGQRNSFYGHDAGYSNSGGSQNTFIGESSGLKCTNGSGNTALGWKSGGSVTNTMTGDRNTSIGQQAGEKIQDGDDNVGVGYLALYDLTDGHDNTCVGQRAGMLLTTGENNLLLGNHSGRSNSPAGNLYTSNNIVCLGNNSITDFYCADTSISSSDKRDKTDITDFTHGLKWINQLKPVTYRWDKRTWYTEYNDDGSVKSTATPDGTKKRARQHIGFLAQDVLAIEQADGYASKKDDMLVVNLNEDDTAYGLKYERLVPVLVNAIKELSAKVETLETKVAALEAA